MMKPVVQKVRAYIETHRLLTQGDRVCIALSGGADSVCLLHVLRELAPEYTLTLSAVHVHHGIRGEEADRDAAFCEELCRRDSVPLTVIRIDAPAISKRDGISLEEAGRLARQGIFRDILANQADRVACAHQRDDLAETVLYNLLRGSGPAGAASLRPKRDGIIRPLLCVTRAEIEAYLLEHDFPHIEDSTNLEETYTRNRIRRSVLPYLEKEVNSRASAHLADFSELLQEADAYLTVQAETAFAECAQCCQGEIFLPEDAFLQLHPYLMGEIVRRSYAEASGSSRDFSRVHTEAVLALFSAENGKRVFLPGGIAAVRKEGGVCICRAERMTAQPGETVFPETVLPVPGTVTVSGVTIRTELLTEKKEVLKARLAAETGSLQKTWCARMDYDKINTILSLRTRRPGDFLVVTKEGGRKTLSDYMTDRKVPRSERDGWPVLADGSEIAALPDGRVSRRYWIEETTGRVLVITAEGGPYGR